MIGVLGEGAKQPSGGGGVGGGKVSFDAHCMIHEGPPCVCTGVDFNRNIGEYFLTVLILGGP